MISEVLSSSNPSLRAANSLRKRLRSGIAIGGFGAVVVLLGDREFLACEDEARVVDLYTCGVHMGAE